MPRLKAYQWAYIHTKVVIILLGVLYFFDISDTSEKKIGTALHYSISAFMVFGSIIAIIGLIISSSQRLNHKRNGLVLEIVGLMLSICGPTSFITIQLLTENEDEANFLSLVLVYSIFSFMFARLISVQRVLRRVA